MCEFCLLCLGFLYANCQSKTAAPPAMLISPDFGSLCTGRAKVMAPLWPGPQGTVAAATEVWEASRAQHWEKREALRKENTYKLHLKLAPSYKVQKPFFDRIL